MFSSGVREKESRHLLQSEIENELRKLLRLSLYIRNDNTTGNNSKISNVEIQSFYNPIFIMKRITDIYI